jgi:hypothetical protein
MRTMLHSCLLTAALVTLSTLALAQEARYQPQAVSDLVEKVHFDLNKGYDVWHLSGDEHERLNKAEKQLRSFAADWRKGKFDKGDLDDSISAIQRVLDKNKLSGAERDALWSDVEQLRSMRQAYDHHEIGK